MKSTGFRLTVLLLCGATALLCATSLLLPGLFASHPQWVETCYSRTFYPAITTSHALLIGKLPFSLGEPALYGVILLGIVIVILGIVWACRRCWRRLLLLLLCTALFASAMWLQFYVSWAFNHSRQPLSVSLSLDTSPKSTKELNDLCCALAQEAKTLRASLPETENGAPQLPSSEDILAAVPSYFAALGEKIPFFSQPVGTPKAVWLSEGLSRLGITGIYLPFTHESNVNVHQPAFLIAATAAHECSHQQGISREDEANFVAYLACSVSNDPAAQYSGTMLALIYCGNALATEDENAYLALTKGYSDSMRRDLCAHSSYWKRYEGKAKEIASAVNDAYLKTHGQEAGVKSYGRMVDLMLAAYEAGMILS